MRLTLKVTETWKTALDGSSLVEGFEGTALTVATASSSMARICPTKYTGSQMPCVSTLGLQSYP